jgi:uncharacterized protein YjbJ (UPF0337 family)
MRSGRKDARRGRMDQLVGGLMDAFGKVTGRRSTRAKGKAARARGTGRRVKGRAKRRGKK